MIFHRFTVRIVNKTKKLEIYWIYSRSTTKRWRLTKVLGVKCYTGEVIVVFSVFHCKLLKLLRCRQNIHVANTHQILFDGSEEFWCGFHRILGKERRLFLTTKSHWSYTVKIHLIPVGMTSHRPRVTWSAWHSCSPKSKKYVI